MDHFTKNMNQDVIKKEEAHFNNFITQLERKVVLQRNLLFNLKIDFSSVQLVIIATKRVAVKTIKPNFSIFKINKEIVKETNALNKLHHPNIIKLIDY